MRQGANHKYDVDDTVTGTPTPVCRYDDNGAEHQGKPIYELLSVPRHGNNGE